MKTTFSPARSRAGSRPGGAKGVLASGAEVRLALAGHRPGECPKNALPALAVLGRSNVGKSSLLNALLGVKVARVSQTPGRTQALYWYRVGDRFDVVDCPGYGYAKTGKEKRISFEGLIESLLLGTPEDAEAAAAGDRGGGATAALLLVDSRIEPQESDLSMSLFLRESSVPSFVAATKWDAVKPSQRVRQLRALTAAFAAPDRPLLPVSAETGENLPELARLLRAALAPSPKE
ncbi:MAG TPA: ribosome biogenesis GTP-binding protein YihA/YsxC [Thermoanaerobaculia bacterium]|nr:ribosome biogenesis GTP-binding protein YihA/YsxC [Thermoanaerobaculia bacterium]